MTLRYRRCVPLLRHLLARRGLAVLLCAATLLLRLLVPTGYMVDSDGGRFAITPCPAAAPPAMTMAMPGMHGAMPGHRHPDGHGKAEMPCAFAGLAAAALGAADPIQLAALIAFVMAAARVVTVPLAPATPPRLRPPLRGPPATL